MFQTCLEGVFRSGEGPWHMAFSLLCLAGEHEAGKGSICRQSRQTGTVQLPGMGSKSVCEQAGRKEGTDKGSGKQRHEATLMVGMMGRKGLVTY